MKIHQLYIIISLTWIICLLCIGKAGAQGTSGAGADYTLKGTSIQVDGPNGKRLEIKYDTIWNKKTAKLAKSSPVMQMTSSSSSSCTCDCLKQLFDYLISSQRLFTPASDNIILSSLIQDANDAGYDIAYTECPLFVKNINKHFYAVTTEHTAMVYKARIGDCSISMNSLTGSPVPFDQLKSATCTNGKVSLTKGAVIRKTFRMTQSLMVSEVRNPSILFPRGPSDPQFKNDTLTTRLFTAWQNGSTNPGQFESYIMLSFFKFDSLVNLPAGVTIQSAKLKLYADKGGFIHQTFNAHLPGDFYSFGIPNFNWDYNKTAEQFIYGNSWFVPPNGLVNISTPFQDLEINMKDWFSPTYDIAHRGMLMRVQLLHNYPTYMTFYSQRHPDVSKQPVLDVAYSLEPAGGVIADLKVDTCYNCAPVASGICYSAVTDTSVNPFTYGIAGNWRAYRSYAYYGTRAETDPSQATNIRKDGTFNDFAAFWGQVGGSWKPQHDTTKWVWNSETTLYNRKGIELENKDPLGRYNSGLYGYDDALPVAVIQNSRFRESAFDGFEDYYFGGNICDTACAGSRNFDFSAYKTNLDTTQQHTGRYSLKVAPGGSAGISAKLVAGESDVFGLSFNKAANNCPGGGEVLKSVRANADVLLPSFSPLSGKKVLVSAWAKESQDCKGTSYTGNQISIIVEQGSTSTTVIAKPTGNIIEGWQRYEQVVELPSGATMLSINLQSTGSAAVYFDDVRIHPYNANMKSFVYNPVNLRLMSELDENNYATFYEYDDDGALIRLKKETSRGIKTIKETRNGLLKEETP